jgi:Flp pilus assembly pilin Flp
LSTELAIWPGGTMLELFAALWKDETGQDLAEYALLLAFIAIAVVVTLPILGSTINSIFSNIEGTLKSAPAGS